MTLENALINDCKLLQDIALKQFEIIRSSQIVEGLDPTKFMITLKGKLIFVRNSDGQAIIRPEAVNAQATTMHQIKKRKRDRDDDAGRQAPPPASQFLMPCTIL